MGARPIPLSPYQYQKKNLVKEPGGGLRLPNIIEREVIMVFQRITPSSAWVSSSMVLTPCGRAQDTHWQHLECHSCDLASFTTRRPAGTMPVFVTPRGCRSNHTRAKQHSGRTSAEATVGCSCSGGEQRWRPTTSGEALEPSQPQGPRYRDSSPV